MSNEIEVTLEQLEKDVANEQKKLKILDKETSEFILNSPIPIRT